MEESKLDENEKDKQTKRIKNWKEEKSGWTDLVIEDSVKKYRA